MRDTTLASLLAAGLVVLLTPFAIHGIDWVHDGAMLKAAMDVHAGQALFRDTLMVYGALTCYLQVFALVLYPSLLSLKLLTLTAYAVSLFFNYLAWRTVLPRSLAVLSAGLFFLFIPTGEYGIFMVWSSVYAMMFQSLVLYGMLQVIAGREPRRWGFIVGVATACTFWCRQPVGVLLAGAVATIWIALRATGWKPPGPDQRAVAPWMLTGFVAVSAALLATIVIPGAVPAWWHQNFVWPREWASKGIGADAWSKYAWLALRPREAAELLALLVAAMLPFGLGKILPRAGVRAGYAVYAVLLGAILWQHDRVLALVSLQTGGWSLAIAAVIGVQIVITLYEAFGPGKAARPPEFYSAAALGVVTLASLPQYFPISDPWHIGWALAPAFGLFVHALWRWTGRRTLALASILIAGLLPAALHTAAQIRASYTQPAVVLITPAALKGMRVSPEQAAVLGKISAAVDPVLARDPHIPGALFGRYATVLSFVPNRENPSPYCFDVEGLTPEPENQKRYRYIHDARPLLFLTNPMRDAMRDYLQRTRYVSQGYIVELDLEILAPREVMASPPVAGGSP